MILGPLEGVHAEACQISRSPKQEPTVERIVPIDDGQIDRLMKVGAQGPCLDGYGDG
jgi:hypothetical protein